MSSCNLLTFNKDWKSLASNRSRKNKRSTSDPLAFDFNESRDEIIFCTPEIILHKLYFWVLNSQYLK